MGNIGNVAYKVHAHYEPNPKRTCSLRQLFDLILDFSLGPLGVERTHEEGIAAYLYTVFYLELTEIWSIRCTWTFGFVFDTCG